MCFLADDFLTRQLEVRNIASIQGIYIALFARPADPLGLAFWNEATTNGSDLSPLIGTLTQEAEYLERFDGMSNAEIVNSIYQSLFGRDAEPAGLAFFIEELTSGRQTIETIGIDYLKLINKDTAADVPLADEWILKLFPSEAPGPGGNPGGGGGGGGGGAPATFTMSPGEAGIVFGGTATGVVTLGVDEEGNLTGSRANQAATFPDGDITVGESVNLSKLDTNIKLTNDLAVHIDAAEADGFTISGDGSAVVIGSDGNQTITITASGDNHISGGLGADMVTLGDGADTIAIEGVDSDLIEAVEDAEAALAAVEALEADLQAAVAEATDALEGMVEVDVDAAQEALDAFGNREDLEAALAEAEELLEEREGLEDAQADAADAAAKAKSATEAAQDALEAAQAAYVEAEADLAAANTKKTEADTKLTKKIEDDLIKEIRKEFKNNATSDKNKSEVTEEINKSAIPISVKNLLIEAIPSKFESQNAIDSYVNTLKDIIKDYKSKAAAGVTTAQAAFDTAEDAVEAAQADLESAEANEAAKQEELSTANAELDAHAEGATTEELQNAANEAQDQLDGYDAAAQALAEALATQANNDLLTEALEEAETALQGNLDAQGEAQTVLNNALAEIAEVGNDSQVGNEDIITNFQVGSDVLILPSTGIVYHEGGEFSFEGQDYSFNVTNGILTFSIGDEPATVDDSNIDALLEYLSNDDVVADGDTVVFEYSGGVYVFQGHAGAADIGVKLAGLSLSGLGSATALFGTILEA